MHIVVKSNTSILIPYEYQNDISRELANYGYVLENGIWNIPNGIIGTISVENFSIEITPNIDYLSFYDYFNLLKLNLSSNLNENFEFSKSNKANSLSHIILDSFRNELIKISKKGIPSKYKVSKDNSLFFKGRTDIVKTSINLITFSDPPVVNYVEKLSLDYPEIIEINKAYRKYVKITGERVLEFEKISKDIPLNSHVNKYLSHISFNKLEYCYDLAYMIINNLNGISRGSKNNLSLLINANAIFEEFIIKTLKLLFSDQPFKEKEALVVAQTEDLISSVRVEPDLMYLGPLTVVLDMKNKNYFKGINSSDYHQMISYMNAFSSNSAVLIYPVISDDYEDEVLNIINGNEKIIRYPVNIRKLNFDLIRKNIARYITFQ